MAALNDCTTAYIESHALAAASSRENVIEEQFATCDLYHSQPTPLQVNDP